MTTAEATVLALRQVESGGVVTPGMDTMGDDGRAISPWQLHPEFFAEWYVPAIGDTWIAAMEKAVRAMVGYYLAEGLTPPQIAQVFHLGYQGWRTQGPDAGYAARFAAAYKPE